jgi:hypothetical protein
LLEDFATWVAKRGRTPDLGLMRTMLELRSAYDDLEPTYWPAGSIEDLLLDIWPAKGPIETPDAETVVETLDSFVRFLRSTGRMSGRSGDPATLAKEARRATRGMAEVAADPVNWSPTKVLMDYGRQLGIGMDDAPNAETLQLRLRQVQEMWNELPIEERRRRMPMPGDAPPTMQGLSGRQRAMAQFGIDEPIVALILTFRDRLPTGKAPDEDEVAPYFAESAFIRQMLALAEWVHVGREVTGAGVLRPAAAKEAYVHLGLGAWQRRVVELEYPDARLPGVAKLGRDAWIERELALSWRSAVDVQELHRLWLGATGSGLVRLEGRRAVSSVEPVLDSGRMVDIGVRAAVAAISDVLRRPGAREALVFALLESYVDGCRLVTREETVDFLLSWYRDVDEPAREDSTWWREWTEPNVDAALAQLDDAGIYTFDRHGLRLTTAGDVFVTAWLKYMESWEG